MKEFEMSTELKKDTLDAIVTGLADGLSLELLTARATLATGRGLTIRQYIILTNARFDTNYSACYGEKDPKDVRIELHLGRVKSRSNLFRVFEEDGTDVGKLICTFYRKDELKKVIKQMGWCVVGGEECLED
jgi:hypothetical protein